MTNEEHNELAELAEERAELDAAADRAKGRDKFATAQGALNDWDEEHGERLAELRRLECAEFWTVRGYTETSTGGGCVAYHKALGTDGAHVLVTASANECELPASVFSGHDAGIYDANGHQTAFGSFVDANSAADWIVNRLAERKG